MPTADLSALLADLLARVPESRTAAIVDANGSVLSQATREGAPMPEDSGAGWRALFAAALAAADRMGQAPLSEVVVETAGATLAMLLLKDTCCLCLLTGPGAIPGRGLFEARKSAAALLDAL